MTFTAIDALAVFGSAALLVGAVAYACVRLKLDWIAWGTLVAASLPPVAYLILRRGGGLGSVAKVSVTVAAVWMFFLLMLWTRFKLMDAVRRSRQLEQSRRSYRPSR